MLKRAHKGVLPAAQPEAPPSIRQHVGGAAEHLELDTLAQIQHVVAGMVGKRLMDRDLVADNGESSVAG